MGEIQLIADWLRRKNQEAARFYLLASAGTLLLGLLAVVVTWWAIYLVLLFGLGWIVELGHTGSMIAAGVVVLLLFPLNAITDRRELEQFQFTTGTAHGKPVSLYIPGVGMGSTINPLAPDSFLSFARALATLLLIGPRVVTAAYQMVVQARRLREMDGEGAAGVLSLLAARDHRAPLEQVIRAVPRGHDAQTILTQLHEVEGVMFLLQSDPPGLSLTSELRQELRQFLKSTVA